VGKEGRVINAGRLFMDSETGLRAINEIDQLARFEFAACHASEAIKKSCLMFAPACGRWRLRGLWLLVNIR